MSIFEQEPQQMDEKGKLGPLRDVCIVVAERTFIARFGQDTEPTIAQMIVRGEPVPHWYYRSKEWVDQPYFIPRELIQPYRGPAKSAYPWLYGEGTFRVDESETLLAIKNAQAALVENR